MDTTIADMKEEYIKGYKSLQAEWKKKDKELLLVGRLAYWVYWLSKLAENSSDPEERKNLFTLKTNGLILLTKSDYVQIRKFVPKFHKKLCYRHYANMKKNHFKAHPHISKRWELFEACSECQKGIEHYFSLYSVAVLNEKEDIEGRKPLFVMCEPYLVLKDEFPNLDSLESVKMYFGNETCTTDIDNRVYELNTNAFSIEMVFKYFTKNYNDLSEYLK